MGGQFLCCPPTLKRGGGEASPSATLLPCLSPTLNSATCLRPGAWALPLVWGWSWDRGEHTVWLQKLTIHCLWINAHWLMFRDMNTYTVVITSVMRHGQVCHLWKLSTITPSVCQASIRHKVAAPFEKAMLVPPPAGHLERTVVAVQNVERSRTSKVSGSCQKVSGSWRRLAWRYATSSSPERRSTYAHARRTGVTWGGRSTALTACQKPPRRQCYIINHFRGLQRRPTFRPPTLHTPARTCCCHFSAQRPRCRNVSIANSNNTQTA